MLLFNYSIDAKVGLNDAETPPAGGFEARVEENLPIAEDEDGGSKLPPGFSFNCLLSQVII